MRYKPQTGSFAWFTHRLTGVALTLYIFLHLYVLSNLRDPASYEALMRMTRTPLVKLMEAGLLALVISHGLNGLRLTLLDTGVPTKAQKILFWTAFAVGAVIFVAGAAHMIGGAG